MKRRGGQKTKRYLSEDDEAGLVGGQPQHDEIGVQPVQAVAGGGVPPGPPALLAHVRHDLVLPLPGRVGVRQHHLQAVSACQTCP